MILAVAAPLIVAVVLIVVAPVPLVHGRWRIRRPGLALAAWLLVIGCGGAALAVSLVTAIRLTVMSGLMAGHGLSVLAVALFAWGGLATLGGLIALTSARYGSLAAVDRRAELRLVLLAAATGYRRTVLGDRSGDVVVDLVDLPGTAAAVATRGCGRQVVVSRGLAEALTPAQLRSVVEHERGHLVLQHDRLLRLARLNAACFGMLWGARAFERSARMLVELVADDRAARRCGAQATWEALDVLAGLGGGEAARLRARRIRALAGAAGAARGASLRPGAAAVDRSG